VWCGSWATQLDEGWDLIVVREVCEEAVSDRWQKAAYWLDKGTEHPHRCSLSVHVPFLDELLEYLRSTFKEKNLQVQVSAIICVARTSSHIQGEEPASPSECERS
jgi:hypothetical protein